MPKREYTVVELREKVRLVEADELRLRSTLAHYSMWEWHNWQRARASLDWWQRCLVTAEKQEAMDD